MEREVEDGRHIGLAHIGRNLGGIRVVDLAEGEEVGVRRIRVALQLGAEGGPELEVDVLDGINPEAIDPEIHPLPINIGHAINDLGVFGHEVIEADEVTEGDGFALPRRVSAVVVESDVIEPFGHHLGLVCRADGSVGEGGLWIEGRETVLARKLADINDIAVGVLVGMARDVLVVVGAFLVVDEVGRVVRDDVEVDLDAARVGRVNEGLHLLVRAQVRIDLGEVGDPIAVIAGRGVIALTLDGIVFQGRRQPNSGGSEPLDVVEFVLQAGEVAAMVEADVSGIEAGGEAVIA